MAYLYIAITADGVESSGIEEYDGTWQDALRLVQEEIDAETGTITKITIEPTEM